MTTQRLNEATLNTPFTNAEGTLVKTITVHKPGVPALRGVKLFDILQGDVDAMMKVLPKITEPPLSPADFDRLDPIDFTDLCVRVMGFMVKADQMEAQGNHLFLGAEDAEELPAS